MILTVGLGGGVELFTDEHLALCTRLTPWRSRIYSMDAVSTTAEEPTATKNLIYVLSVRHCGLKSHEQKAGQTRHRIYNI